MTGDARHYNEEQGKLDDICFETHRDAGDGMMEDVHHYFNEEEGKLGDICFETHRDGGDGVNFHQIRSRPRRSWEHKILKKSGLKRTPV
ncbi:hypothetical protein CEXT_450571 [Caerostris extrusa]|uniref:Uncharacterized protein n=1 Tax=Caerostris extrusa TaxID=172846 RepID=A0AAV4UN54_CAEEX|nr:hypothetical protein CEXT_450571 [Caerostris extrusa]